MTGILTFLDNCMFSCRQTSTTLLAPSFLGSYTTVLCVDASVPVLVSEGKSPYRPITGPEGSRSLKRPDFYTIATIR
jgi:hypothetical protein